jgi:hypothetical protein
MEAVMHKACLDFIPLAQMRGENRTGCSAIKQLWRKRLGKTRKAQA